MIEESSDTESAGLPSEASKISKPETKNSSKPSPAIKASEKELKPEDIQIKFKKPKRFRHIRTFFRWGQVTLNLLICWESHLCFENA